MLWVRGVNDRLEKLAPFLSYDTDPYPVALDGRAVWVVDAYTTTTRYPYGQRIGDVQRKQPSGLARQRQLRPQQRQGRRRRLLR